MSELQQAATIEVVVTFFASLGFLMVYTAVAPWWRSGLGRNLVAFDSLLALTLAPGVIHHFWGTTAAESNVFAWFTVLSFALIPIVILWRTVILVSLQLRGGNADEEAGGEQ